MIATNLFCYEIRPTADYQKHCAVMPRTNEKKANEQREALEQMKESGRYVRVSAINGDHISGVVDSAITLPTDDEHLFATVFIVKALQDKQVKKGL